MMSMFPLGRTPMDKESAKSMSDYARTIQTAFDKLTPWVGSSRMNNLRKMVKSGQVVVIADGSDRPDDPLYKGAKVLKG